MTNFNISDTVARLKHAKNLRLKSIKIPKFKLNLQLVHILYKNGVICSFNVDVDDNTIKIFLKYFKNMPVYFNLKLISLPSRRIYWTLNKLSLTYSSSCFNGFYIISTSAGLITSNDCLLGKRISGEIVLKVDI